MSGKLQIEEAINRLEEVRSVCLGMALSEMIEKDEFAPNIVFYYELLKKLLNLK